MLALCPTIRTARLARQSLAAFLAVWLVASDHAAAESTLQLGYAQLDITPRVDGERPVWIAGYGHNRRAEGVHDPLYVRALVLSDGAQKIALVSLDLIGLQRPAVLQIRKRAPDMDYVLVASTHNHEGPDVVGLWGPSPLQSGVDPTYVARVIDHTVECLRQAASDLQPVTGQYGVAQIPAEWLRDSRLPVVRDDQLRVVAFRQTSSEQPAALLVQYSCHPESLSSKNVQLTADFPAPLIAALQRRYDCPVAYFTGAVGGLMTHPAEFADASGKIHRDGNFEYADAYGKALAEVAAKAIETAEPIDLTPLRAAAVEVAVPLANPLYHAARAMGVLQREAVVFTGDWRDVSRPATDQTPAAELAVVSEACAVAAGDLTIVGIPGEIYPELVYGEYQEPVDPGADYPEAPLEPSLRELFPGKHPLYLGLANDEIGYILPKRQWDQRPPFAYGRSKSQYGEVNSCGADAAPLLMEAFRTVGEQLRKQP